MMMVSATVLFAAAASAAADAPATRTEVKNLPGYGAPPSRMFAGFSSGGMSLTVQLEWGPFPVLCRLSLLFSLALALAG